ncbi:MAG: lysyl oxidase family protein [Kibdelosporangium sp.]
MGRKWIAGALAVLTAMVVIPPATADEPLLLPDLRQAPPGCSGGYPDDPSRCRDWDVCMVADAGAPNGTCRRTGPIGAVRLRFTSAEDNVGDGPLVLFGQRDPGSSTMSVRQGFQAGRHGHIPGSYAEARQQTQNSMYYEPAPMHLHWHLMDFERMQLRDLAGGAVVTDRKTGFCLGDRYTVHDAYQLPNLVRYGRTPEYELSKYLQYNMCASRDPSATELKAGISVGSGDDYRYDVDFQWLDITSVPSGTYDLVNTVNSSHTLRETDYGNNSSSIAISIQWPGRAANPPAVITAPPVVKLLRSCPGAERCAARTGMEPRISSDQIQHAPRHKPHH